MGKNVNLSLQTSTYQEGRALWPNSWQHSRSDRNTTEHWAPREQQPTLCDSEHSAASPGTAGEVQGAAAGRGLGSALSSQVAKRCPHPSLSPKEMEKRVRDLLLSLSDEMVFVFFGPFSLTIFTRPVNSRNILNSCISLWVGFFSYLFLV